MEIIVSVFAALVAVSCLFAVLKSDFKDRRALARHRPDTNDS
jgi:hypothetical protein